MSCTIFKSDKLKEVVEKARFIRNFFAHDGKMILTIDQARGFLNDIFSLLEHPIMRKSPLAKQAILNGKVILNTLGQIGHSVPDLPKLHVHRSQLGDSIEKALTSNERYLNIYLDGITGIGKTSLAIRVAHKVMEEGSFGIVRWMRAYSAQVLEEDWRRVGEGLGVKHLEEEGDRKSLVRKIVSELCFQSGGSWLLIYDNANDLTSIKDLMPDVAQVLRELPESEDRVRILITTQEDVESDPGVEVIEIGNLTPAEAVEIMKRRGAEGSDEDLEQIAARVSFHALSVETCGALMRAKKYNSENFLKILEERRLKVLDERGAPKPQELNCVVTANELLRLVFEKFKEENNEAWDLLIRLSLLSPDRIEDTLLKELVKRNLQEGEGINTSEEGTELSLEILRKYSMVSQGSEARTCKVHRLVQEAVRGFVGSEAVSEAMGDILGIVMKTCENDANNGIKTQVLVPHINSVCSEIVNGADHEHFVTRLGVRNLCDFYIYIGLRYTNMNRGREATLFLIEAVRMAEKIPSGGDAILAEALNRLGLSYSQAGSSELAISTYRRSLEIYRKLHGENHYNVATLLGNIGCTYRKIGLHTEATNYLEKSLRAKEILCGENNHEVGITLNMLGFTCTFSGDLDRAIKYYERALAIYKREFGEVHKKVAETIQNMAIAMREMGRYSEAIRNFEKALRIYEEFYKGEDHRDIAQALIHLGYGYKQFGDPIRAISFIERALAIKMKEFGNDHSVLIWTLTYLGSALSEAGRYSEAITNFNKALSIAEKFHGTEHREIGLILTHVGLAHKICGDLELAIATNKRALALLESKCGHEHTDVAITHWRLGSVYSEKGDHTEALKHLEKARVIMIDITKGTHARASECLTYLANGHLRAGNYSEAWKYHDQAMNMKKAKFGEDDARIAENLEGFGDIHYKRDNDIKMAIVSYEKARDHYTASYMEGHPDIRKIKEKIENIKSINT